MIILIGILSVLCIVLFSLLLSQKRDVRAMLSVLHSLKQGQNRKILLHQNSIYYSLGMEINSLVEEYTSQLINQQRLEEANRELLTNLSHDVRTPLTSLLGYLDALEKGMVEEEEKEKYIQIARKKAYDLKDLVNTLFDWFKINAKEIDLALEPIDLCELTKETVIEWIPVWEQNKVATMIQIPDTEYMANIDITAYKRAVSNIIQNAMQHSQCTKIELKIEYQDHHILLTMKDNGIGIPKDKLPYIFERLYKIDVARSKRSSGLGLCIAKELIEMQFGTITVNSEYHQYTEFIITLPRIEG